MMYFFFISFNDSCFGVSRPLILKAQRAERNRKREKVREKDDVGNRTEERVNDQMNDG